MHHTEERINKFQQKLPLNPFLFISETERVGNKNKLDKVWNNALKAVRKINIKKSWASIQQYTIVSPNIITYLAPICWTNFKSNYLTDSFFVRSVITSILSKPLNTYYSLWFQIRSSLLVFPSTLIACVSTFLQGPIPKCSTWICVSTLSVKLYSTISR